MKENINRFSLKRTLMLTGTELTEKRRTLLLQSGMVALVLIVMACIQAFGNDYQYSTYTGDGDPVSSDLLGIYLVMLFIFGCLSASIMFSDLAIKEGRIRMLMRPGLAIEKFLSRCFIYIIIFLIVYGAAVFVADSMRYIILKIRFPESHCIIPIYSTVSPALLKDILPFHEPVFRSFVIAVGFYVGIQSFFVLGSVIWPRMSFPKTFGVFTGLIFAYSMIFAGVAELCMDGIYYSGASFLQVHWFGLLTTLLYGATALNYVLAWLRLGETEVITTKR